MELTTRNSYLGATHLLQRGGGSSGGGGGDGGGGGGRHASVAAELGGLDPTPPTKRPREAEKHPKMVLQEALAAADMGQVVGGKS